MQIRSGIRKSKYCLHPGKIPRKPCQIKTLESTTPPSILGHLVLQKCRASLSICAPTKYSHNSQSGRRCRNYSSVTTRLTCKTSRPIINELLSSDLIPQGTVQSVQKMPELVASSFGVFVRRYLHGFLSWLWRVAGFSTKSLRRARREDVAKARRPGTITR